MIEILLRRFGQRMHIGIGGDNRPQAETRAQLGDEIDRAGVGVAGIGHGSFLRRVAANGDDTFDACIAVMLKNVPKFFMRLLAHRHVRRDVQ